jgi:hypothetical protein
MFVYVITNTESNKFYIGKTTKLELYPYLKRKLAEASRGRQSHLFNAMRKYPKRTWDIHPLISCLTTNWQLCLWEKALIYAFDSTNPDKGYNICRGGEGFSGPHSKETRDKMSESHKRQWADPKARNEHSETMKRVLASPAAKSNKSRAMKKLYTTSKVVVESLRKGWYGPKDYSSEALRKRWADSETRQETIKAIKNWWTPERRIAFSQRPRDERGRLLSVV